MAIELPKKKYYTFLELATRLQCSELDLRHLVIEREITPSAYLECMFYRDYQIHADEDEDGRHLWPSQVTDWESKSDDCDSRTQLVGFHFLIFSTRISADSCEFNYASKSAYGHDEGDICYGLEQTYGLDYVIKSGVVMADELARFEALHSVENEPTNLEKPLSKREQDTLLTIIAVLCKEAKIDYNKPAKAAGMIQSTAATMGVSIGETTIENHLKKIPDALATRMK